MKLQKLLFRALVARNLRGALLLLKGTVKTKLQKSLFRALVARNFYGIHFREKGTII